MNRLHRKSPMTISQKLIQVYTLIKKAEAVLIDKLLCLQLDLGGEVRQVFAGIKSAASLTLNRVKVLAPKKVTIPLANQKIFKILTQKEIVVKRQFLT